MLLLKDKFGQKCKSLQKSAKKKLGGASQQNSVATFLATTARTKTFTKWFQNASFWKSSGKTVGTLLDLWSSLCTCFRVIAC